MFAYDQGMRTWSDQIESGRVAEVIASSSSLESAATRLGTTVAALRRAWSRYGEGSLADLLGSTPRIEAEDLDGLRVSARGRSISFCEARTIRLEPEDGEIWLIPGDIHFGIQDDTSLALMQHCAEDIGCDRVVLQGDTYDCFGISDHDQPVARVRGGAWTLADEREEARDFMEWVRQVSQNSGLESWMLWGNHEHRLVRLANKNPALDGSLSIRSIFDIPESVRIASPGDRVRAGSLVIEHGDAVLGSGGGGQFAAKKVYTAQPDQTTIFGHIHRAQEWRHTTYDEYGRPRTRLAMSVGHLSRAEAHAHYAGIRPNWQQTFAVVQFFYSRAGDLRYEIANVEIHDHEFSFRGRTYR